MMSTKKLLKLVLGIVTCWPGAYLLAFVLVIVLATAVHIASGGSRLLPGFTAWQHVVATMHFPTAFMTLGLSIAYAVYVILATRLAPGKRCAWAMLLFMVGPITMPLFFWWYVWPEAAREDPK